MPAPIASTRARPNSRAALCRELLDIEREHREVFARIDAIKADLKRIAAAEGSFREDFPGLGHVSVSPEKPKTYKGDLPVLSGDAWLALKQKQRDRLVADGLVRIEPQYTGAYYGRVDAKLLTA